MKIRRTVHLGAMILIGILFTSALASCGGREPILIGFSAGLTGRTAALGVDGRDGALLAVETINAEGGIQGSPIELLAQDDLATAEGSIAADKELVDAGVVAIIGHMTSETMMSAWPSLKDTGIIYLSPTVSTPALQGIDDNFFRLIPVNSSHAGQLALYATDELGVKRVAVFYDLDNQAFTETYLEGFAAQFEKSGQIVARYGFSSSTHPDFFSMLQEVSQQNPDAIFIIASAVDTALIAQQANLLNIDAQLLASNWSLTDDLIQNGGKTVEGILTVVAHDENNQSPTYLDFKSRFEERFGRRPTFAAGYGYEAVLVLASALERTGNQVDELADALLETRDFPGIHGRISLDAYGDVHRTLYLISVQDGAFVTLRTFDVSITP